MINCRIKPISIFTRATRPSLCASGKPIGQHVLGGLDGYGVTPVVRDLIFKKNILGFTLFRRNIESPEHLRSLTEELKSLSRKAGYDLVLAVDQEGGRVARLPVPPYTKVASMREWGKRAQESGDFSVIEELGILIAREVRHAGFNLNFAPVVDVDLNPDSPVIGDRSFSNDAELVYRCAKSLLAGFKGGGMIGCLKHFPGHGATTLDSHQELPHDDRPLTELLSCDLLPYSRLIYEGIAPAVMSAHVVYDAIDPDYPATLSEIILDGLLRKRLRYSGSVFSDDMQMKAIGENPEDLLKACLRFYEVGGDVALVCKNEELIFHLIERLETVLADQSASSQKILSQLERSQGRVQRLIRAS